MSDLSEIINYLNNCKPYQGKQKEHPLLRWANKIRKIFTITAAGLIFFPIISIKLISKPALPDHLIRLLLGMVILGAIVICLALFVPMIMEVAHTVLERKRSGLERFQAEIGHDEKNADALISRPEIALERAGHHLKAKIDRIDRRIALFTGTNLTFFSAITAIYQLVSVMGGTTWLITTIKLGPRPGNIVDSMLYMALALFVGILIGAILLKISQQRYAYQLDLVALALLRKSSKATNSAPSHTPRRLRPCLQRVQ